MERRLRRKLVAQKRRHRGSSSNPRQNEDRLVRPFPPTIHFRHEGQSNKFNSFMSRQFAPMKYLSTSSLQTGLLNEVNVLIARMGWEAFFMKHHPT